MTKNLLLAPMAETNPALDGSIAQSWDQRLSEAGFQVTQRNFGWKRNGFEYVRIRSGIVLPSSAFNAEQDPVGMSFDSIHALQGAMYHNIPIFSERSIVVNLLPLVEAFSDDPLIQEFSEIAHELDETVIGYDVSIIQERLGEA